MYMFESTCNKDVESVDSKHSKLLKFWGEERTKDALYTVFIKRINYHQPFNDETFIEDSRNEISYLQWETKKIKVLKAGSLNKLIESFIDEAGEMDSAFVNVFFSTYRTFTTASEVLNIILKRCYIPSSFVENLRNPENQTRKVYKQILTFWLENYPEDFQSNDCPNCLDLQLFAKLSEFFGTDEYLKNKLINLKINHSSFPDDFQSLGSNKYLEVNGHLSNYPVDAGKNSIKMFLCLHSNTVAEQLTRMDCELFLHLIPYQCLGAIWSNNDKLKNKEASTVIATIQQFNAVSFRVISTILMSADFCLVEGTKVLLKWIEIAQELRILKNFSSLKAIVSCLQSLPIHRLKKIWNVIPKEKMEIFNELANIFNEDDNLRAQRNLLEKEGTAKFANFSINSDKYVHRAVQKYYNVVYGTIPYLGTFLTDLTMINTAMPDLIDGELLHFEKRRKEFEILAQIKLLRSSAQLYNFYVNIEFQRWYNFCPILDEKFSYKLSCFIEPDESIQKSFNLSRNCLSVATKKFDFNKYINNISYMNFDLSIPTVEKAQNQSYISRSYSKSTSDLSISKYNVDTNNFLIIKVALRTRHNEKMKDRNVYKSIKIYDHEHATTVIKKALDKHNISEDPTNFQLIQVLPNKEITFPPSANVYYAANSNSDFMFTLRQKIK